MLLSGMVWHDMLCHVMSLHVMPLNDMLWCGTTDWVNTFFCLSAAIPLLLSPRTIKLVYILLIPAKMIEGSTFKFQKMLY
jgi:hypothetical protein